MTWKDAHARGKLPVLKEVSPKLYCSQGKFWLSFRRSMFQSIEFQTQAFLAAVVVELALRGRPVREAGESLSLCCQSFPLAEFLNALIDQAFIEKGLSSFVVS